MALSLPPRILPLADRLLALFVYPAAWLLKRVRRVGVHKLPACKRALLSMGVFPIRNHYYEPQFDFSAGPVPDGERSLPGIDWNVEAQLELLTRMTYAGELEDIDRQQPSSSLDFSLQNDNFLSGDAEVWYQMVRLLKPKRIIEIGSGYSTLLAVRAAKLNAAEGNPCEHVCIEPYEMDWLPRTGVRVIREPVESLGIAPFQALEAGDILFIDSSHVIRPNGDVLAEYLSILPTLKPGVVVHVHDIFSPRNYPREWIEEKVQFWNEQYLLEAFLSHNADWEVVAALNLLHHRHFEQLSSVAPYLTRSREPGSFYMRRTR